MGADNHPFAFGVAFPEWEVDAAEIAEWTGGKTDFIRGKVGVESRRYLAPGETGVELGARAVENLVASSPGVELSAIDLVVCVTQNPDYRLPQNSSLLANRLGLASNVASFDISLGCSGWVYALSVVKGLMLAEDLSNALIVTVDPYSKIMRKSDRATVTVFGDGAAATLITKEMVARIGRADFGTDGSLGHHLSLRQGGAASPYIHLGGRNEINEDESSLHMDGRAILEFMMTRVPAGIDECLRRNSLARDDIDLFVFHQASKYMLQQLIRVASLPAEKTPIDVSSTGNTVSSSIPIILNGLHKEGELSGKRALVCGFGVGLSWATNIVDF